MESLCGFGSEISVRVLQSPRTSLDIVLCRLQTVQEGEESVASFKTTRSSMRRGRLRKRFLLHGERRFEIDLCGFDAFMTKPQRDHRAIDTRLEKVHGHGVSQAMVRDSLAF